MNSKTSNWVRERGAPIVQRNFRSEHIDRRSLRRRSDERQDFAMAYDEPLLPEPHLMAIAQDFVHPCEVLRDERLGEAGKRAILCFRASDACAVDSRPGFRWLPGTPGPILIDHIMETLQTLEDGLRLDSMPMQRAGSRAQNIGA